MTDLDYIMSVLDNIEELYNYSRNIIVTCANSDTPALNMAIAAQETCNDFAAEVYEVYPWFIEEFGEVTPKDLFTVFYRIYLEEF